jgi:hypothetical protein
MISISATVLWLAFAFAYSARNDAICARRERDDYHDKWREAERARRDEMLTNKDLRALIDQLRNGAPYR